MGFALHSIHNRHGRVLSARMACVLTGLQIRAGGVQSIFPSATTAIDRLGGDSPSPRTTRGKAMFNPISSSAHASALAAPFPAPLQAREARHVVSVGRLSVWSGFCKNCPTGYTPMRGSSPRTFKAGNSSPVECVGSGAGSY